jgi:hypothetical protein
MESGCGVQPQTIEQPSTAIRVRSFIIQSDTGSQHPARERKAAMSKNGRSRVRRAWLCYPWSEFALFIVSLGDPSGADRVTVIPDSSKAGTNGVM